MVDALKQIRAKLKKTNGIKIEVWLSHNDNFFCLPESFYSFAQFSRWWRENKEAYLLLNASVFKRGLRPDHVSVLIGAEDE